MKVVNLKSGNVITCDCGNAFEFGYGDYEAQIGQEQDSLFQVGVRCPICGKMHILNPDSFDDTLSRENVFKYRSPMSDCTLAEIAARCNNYYETGKMPFMIGDSKPIMLNSGETTGLVFIGVDEFCAKQTGERAPLSFMFEHCLSNDQVMNRTNTNRGGWRNSYMRKYLNEEFIKLVPDDLLSIIKMSKKWTMNSGESPTMTEDKFYLLSGVEVFGTHQYSNDGEGTQYEFFKDWRNRLRSYRNTASGVYWWLRSPRYYDSSFFCGVSYSGGLFSGNAGGSRGVSPAFTL